jgi:hypothetical protein
VCVCVCIFFFFFFFVCVYTIHLTLDGLDLNNLRARARALEQKANELEAAHEDELRRRDRVHTSELEAQREQHGREVSSLRRQAADEQAQLQEQVAALGEQTRAAVAEAARVRAEADEQERRMGEQVREAAAGREAAERHLSEMKEFIEEAKVVDKRNARLDAQMSTEISRRKKLHDYVEDLKGKIRVYVRVRPMSQSETEKQCQMAYTKNHENSLTYFQPEKAPPEDKKSFDFDKVYAGTPQQGNAQDAVFGDLKNLILSCVEGRNVCIFAYGQTGAGKTFSMVGADGSIGGNISALENPNRPTPLPNAGVTPRAIVELFSVLEERDALNVGEVDTSMYELYCDSLVDLLNPKAKEKKLNIKLAQHTDSGLVEVEGGTVKRTSTMQELIAVMEKGIKVIVPCRFVIAAFRCCSSRSN